jgi:hypothetical protein
MIYFPGRNRTITHMPTIIYGKKEGESGVASKKYMTTKSTCV